jgi:hypothetical protein
MQSFTRRALLTQSLGAALSGHVVAAAAPLPPPPESHLARTDGPDAIFEKPTPLSTAEAVRHLTQDVNAVTVSDYKPGRYSGPLTPSPPHADFNPAKAVLIQWRNSPCRFVFSHEASYSPYLELPDGTALFSQHFEGNLGDAELLNNSGRKEKNSFVDIIESGPDRAWVRWNYFAVHKEEDHQPRLRAVEDYFAYPNGLVLRRASYESLMPDAVVGYSTQPVELCSVLPAGGHFRDFMQKDPALGDYNVFSAIEVYGTKRYDVFWNDAGGVRRNGDDMTLRAIEQSPGYALALPFRSRILFAILGRASGFSPANTQLIEHSTPGAEGGLGMGQRYWWDHWPIGWKNSQGNYYKPGSAYPSHLGGIGTYLVPDGKRIRSFVTDYPELCKDMNFNRKTAREVYYILLGSATDLEEVRRIGRAWLNKGIGCAKPSSIAGLVSY